MLRADSEPRGAKSLRAMAVLTWKAATAARIVTANAPARVGIGRRAMIAAARVRNGLAPGIVSAIPRVTRGRPRPRAAGPARPGTPARSW